MQSLPSRERGLKLKVTGCNSFHSHVAPLAGAWIEIVQDSAETGRSNRRSPRGSVD